MGKRFYFTFTGIFGTVITVAASESHHKGTVAHSVRSLAVFEEWVRPANNFPGLGSGCCEFSLVL